MQSRSVKLFILGATGFIGREVVREAIRNGHRVTVLVRDRERAKDLAALGVEIVEGDGAHPDEWVQHAVGADVLTDLIQPPLPKRIGVEEITVAAHHRLDITDRLCTALETIPADQRPMLLMVSGIDDLAPDVHGRVDDRSPLRARSSGFSHIGIPVRRRIERSVIHATFAYLGTVYGPGKGFASTVFPQLSAGKFRMAGSGHNHTPMIHVEDAARALVHLAALDREQVQGRSFVVADGSNASMSEFLRTAAELLGVRPPKMAPAWLASLFAGKALVETLTRDVIAEPRALLQTGFAFRYPSYREGLPPTLDKLGYTQKLSNTLPKASILDGGVMLGALAVLAIGMFVAANVIVNSPNFKRLTGGLPIFDMRFGYSAATASQFIDVIGARGRAAYLKFIWSVDLFAPILFGAFLSGAIRRTPLRRLNVLAFLAAAFDYAENIAVTILLLQYPAGVRLIVPIASTLTMVKWVLYAASVLAAISGLALSVRSRLIGRVAVDRER
jgi:2-alkyl-3-oxoalkanoate reductase